MSKVLTAGLSPDLVPWLEQRLRGVSFQCARTGEETLSALERNQFALLIIDHTLDCPPASEVLARARANPSLKTLPVIYCAEKHLGSEMGRKLIEELGVQRLMIHPLDREELARQVATILDVKLETVDSAQSQQQKELLQAMAKVWEQFKATSLVRIQVLEQATAALLRGSLGDELRAKAGQEAHKLAGSLGTFGLAEGSRLARDAELILHSFSTLTQAQALPLSEIVLKMRRQVEGAVAAPLATPEPAAIEKGTYLLIVDDDKELAEQLAREAATHGMRAEIALHPTLAREKLEREKPDVVVLDLVFAEGMADSLNLLGELSSCIPPVPVLVFTVSDAIIDRVEVARRGARGFLLKPLPPAEVLEAIAQLLGRARSGETKILVLDDDPTILLAIHSLLEPQNLTVITLDDPLHFWEVLEESSPDLLILDVEMPHLSGMELCRVVRNDPRWSHLPVLFLTQHRDAETMHRVFEAGADDFVAKPILGPELLTRVLNRLERTRLQRSLADTDGLTGLDNRRKSTQRLNQLLRLAQRRSQPLSFGILDLDHFKRINDRFGHASGDAVLRRLAQILQQTFRAEDVVARWGGEEFVVGIYATKRADGVHRLATLLERVREETFPEAGAGQLRLTFSAGLAQFPQDGSDLQSLYRAADQALYQAKAAGGDRVQPTGRLVERPQAVESVDVAVVEDDEVLAQLLLHSFQTRGYRARWFKDGQAAADALAGESPSVHARLVVLDVDLPGLDGLSILRHLARANILLETRVIMLTVRAGEAEVVRALEMGAFDHVAKPFSLPVLLHRIRRALEA